MNSSLIWNSLTKVKSKISGNLLSFNGNCRVFHTTSHTQCLFESDPRAGFGINPGAPEISWKTTMDGFKLFCKGVKDMKDEFVEWIKIDKVMEYRPGEVEQFFNFQNEDSIKDWFVNCDSDHGLGYSTCSLTRNLSGNAVFSGEICTRTPKDGKVFRSGYCNIRSPAAVKSFDRESYYEWGHYTHLVLKVRGDGRPYMVNIGTKGYHDITWFDMFSYALFTRGGPHWQITRIPFSKFIFNYKGHIQDKQAPVPLNRVTSFGLTMSDSCNGPFNLEIEYIGLELDPGHEEETAYELYLTPTRLTDN